MVQGYSSFITVTMTFSADAITACDIDASSETPGIGDVVAAEYSAGVVKDQSVDIVTSATAGYTIPAIRRAVEKSGQVVDWYQETLAKYGVTEYLHTYNGTA